MAWGHWRATIWLAWGGATGLGDHTRGILVSSGAQPRKVADTSGLLVEWGGCKGFMWEAVGWLHVVGWEGMRSEWHDRQGVAGVSNQPKEGCRASVEAACRHNEGWATNETSLKLGSAFANATCLIGWGWWLKGQCGDAESIRGARNSSTTWPFCLGKG